MHKKTSNQESSYTERAGEGLEPGSNSKAINLSKAKHLWVNYGRRILDHAVGQINAEMQDRLKPFTGRLNSKRNI